MSFKFRWFIILILFSSPAWSEGKKLACDPDTNICSVAISENFCGSDGVPKAKFDIRSQSYILSCECDCSSQENTFWILSADGKVQTLDASKIVSGVDIIKNKSGVPDAFGVVPYCQPINASGESLVYLQKGPGSAGQPQPYCYSVLEHDEPQKCESAECLSKIEMVSGVEKNIKEELLVEFKNATSRLYKDKARFSGFPKRDFIERFIGEYGYSSASQQVFNDVAFFWQQAGFNTDAIWLLKKVISENPKRTVAYLNLADAYWEAGDKASAGKNYKVYTDLMSENGKQAKVPDRVRQRATTQ